jgi:hypothetical protein
MVLFLKMFVLPKKSNMERDERISSRLAALFKPGAPHLGHNSEFVTHPDYRIDSGHIKKSSNGFVFENVCFTKKIKHGVR